MKSEYLLGLLLILVILSVSSLPTFADTLMKEDFLKESFAKNIDFMDYARAFAQNNGMEKPPADWHANLYVAYVNTKGLQMVYTGVENITLGQNEYFSIPMQSVLMHYKSPNRSRDVVMASTFLMLMAFNETGTTEYTGSPDYSDSLWASFSLSFNFSHYLPGLQLPPPNNKVDVFPLTSSSDKLEWTWGMRYRNLTAIWWRTWVAPNNASFVTWPNAVTIYDELTFKYTLTIDPTTNTSRLREDHTIGRIRDLWYFWLWPLPLVSYYNGTGGYLWRPLLQRYDWASGDTVYDFLEDNDIMMSIVNFQTSIVADRKTTSKTTNEQNATDIERVVSDSSISTYSDEGERIYDASFGVKKTYNLYNYTADQTENTFQTYDATARTQQISGYAKNTGLFAWHIGLLKFVPLLIANMYPLAYAYARATIANMTQANYFYAIGYPTYSGYKIAHDPQLMVYLDTTALFGEANNSALGGVLLIAIVVVAAAASIVLIRRRRKHVAALQPAQTRSDLPLPPPTTLEPRQNRHIFTSS